VRDTAEEVRPQAELVIKAKEAVEEGLVGELTGQMLAWRLLNFVRKIPSRQEDSLGRESRCPRAILVRQTESVIQARMAVAAS
jgi:hypothetical protein